VYLLVSGGSANGNGNILKRRQMMNGVECPIIFFNKDKVNIHAIERRPIRGLEYRLQFDKICRIVKIGLN
jgi:hypothetical protein